MSHTTSYVIGGQSINFPNLASGVAIKNAAKRFEASWGLPADAAFGLAASMVNPAEDRATINSKAPFEHLQAIQTPDGQFLLAHRTRVWTCMVSGDGGNGRSRYTIQTTNNNGVRPRPWPIGRHHKPAIVDYHPRSLADMVSALKISAGEIRSQDLITQIARNPRGVWNPPVVVLARAYVGHGVAEERWFQHTVEGSTRVEACHELTGVDASAPLEHSGSPLEHLRETHKGFVERFATTPTSLKTLAAARAATMPALIVVAALEDDGVTPISAGFPVTINDYVESVHVQPRPFSDAAQSNVIGERFVLTLEKQGRMTREDAEAILGRIPDVVGKPSVRAAKIVRAVCEPDNDSLLRDFLITEEGAKLTKLKRAKLIGPLVVRQFNETAPSAERALMRAFTPELLLGAWTVTGVDSETLRQTCIADVQTGAFETQSIAELMARGGPALCASGLLLSDQESTVKGIAELRGSVDRVIDGLAKNLGGVNVLADAIAWADGDRLERPRQYDIEGQLQVDKYTGDVLHFSTAWQKGNMGVRALAFTKGKIPTEEKPNQKRPVTPISPEETFKEAEEKLLAHLLAGQTSLKDMYTATDAQDIRLIEKLGMRKAHVYERFPAQLSKLYAKHGVTVDLFDEDELPDSGVLLPADEDDADGLDEQFEIDTDEREE